MKLIEALKILKAERPADADPFRAFLACGFEPAHVETFLAAHLQARVSDRQVVVETGLYGDFTGNLSRLADGPLDAGVAILEWSDLDPRLGLRALAGWSVDALDDIVATVTMRLVLIRDALEAAAGRMPIALCPPTLPLPPIAPSPGWQSGRLELELGRRLGDFTAWAAALPTVRVVSPQRLATVSAPAQRLDVASELRAGCPYALPHASAVAEAAARLVMGESPKKGLITDLDDTLWRGILGEAGVDGVSWDLNHHSHMHAVYQQLLASLAEAGILLAVASKNAPDLVEQAFERRDLLLPRDRVFPIEANWGPKSASVGRIREVWNIGADSIVFVDDSPMEIAEVRAAHPDVECIQFPVRDDQAVYQLIERLRDVFGKETIREEDALRLDSIRSASAVREHVEEKGASLDNFLAQAEGIVTLDFTRDPPDPRALELVNKTNQFNLNGIRFSEAEWHERLRSPDAFLVVVSYEDKFGPLGKIAVLLGRREKAGLRLEAWAMSCRAFARRIEHRCIEQLLDRSEHECITFEFNPTPRNGPLQAFLEGLLGHAPEPGCTLTKARFAEGCPPLFGTVREPSNG